LFDNNELCLLGGAGDAIRISPKPVFASVQTLTRGAIEIESPVRLASAGESTLRIDLPLRLAPATDGTGPIAAVAVPVKERPWLARLLYALPPQLVESLRIAATERYTYLISDRGVGEVPIGTPFREVAPGVHTPIGLQLTPRFSGETLLAAIPNHEGHLTFFHLGEQPPEMVPKGAFTPLSFRSPGLIAPPLTSTHDTEPPLPLFTYGKAKRFPLWGMDTESGEDEP
ncbi:MAG: hypothetical protein KC416_16615, partial [Myxococcales bacterium]|nr:hypothetical protein [Myxococcales bacterium]